MGVIKDTPDEVPSIPEVDDEITFDPDKCNSCPPTYDSSSGAFNSRMSLARTNSSNSMTSLRGNSFPMKGMHRSASSNSFQTESKGKLGRSLSRTMSASSFNMSGGGGAGGAGERHMSRSMSSASFFFSGEEFEDESDFTLQYTRHERVPIKNFGNDIRASSDVEQFVKQAVLFLDLDETNLEEIVDTMLEQLIDDEEPHVTIHEAKMDLFTNDNANLTTDNSAHHLSKTMQGTYKTMAGGTDYDQQWITILCTLPALQKRRVAIARLKKPANLGRTSQEIHFIILVVAPARSKGTKNALETGRTFSTLFQDVDLRYRLQNASTGDEFNQALWEHTRALAIEQREAKKKKHMSSVTEEPAKSSVHSDEDEVMKCVFGRGLVADVKRRWPHYWSDYVDGFVGPRTLGKTVSGTLFLYFACLLPTIALGHLNDYETHGKIGVKEAIYGQTISGLFFAIFGGQAMVVLLTTAPLAIYTKIIYSIADDLDYDFLSMYAMVGIWNGFFCIVYGWCDVGNVMNWARRSTEEVFALFVSVAFAVDAGKGIYKEFNYSYHSDYCRDWDNYDKYGTNKGAGPIDYSENYTSPYGSNTSGYDYTTAAYGNETDNYTTTAAYGYEKMSPPSKQCLRESSVLHVLLCFGTVWMALYIYNFTKTPYLPSYLRELSSSYALPFAALFMSFMGSYVFEAVKLKDFYYSSDSVFTAASFEGIDIGAGFVSMGLGFCMSLLFMIDQHECAGLTSIPDNKLKKGNAFHWDLFVVGVLNIFLSIFGLPMVHGALPHSPLYVRVMGDVEDRIDGGLVTQVVLKARETRVPAIFSHILIGLSLLLLPKPLQYIPRAVLDGIFLYLAIIALDSSQMFERIKLFFTEQAAYPPTHYIRSVPQRKLHLFTVMQILQLGVMCAIGFSPLSYLKMLFPILILIMLPVRHNLMPLLIENRYLTAIDGEHH